MIRRSRLAAVMAAALVTGMGISMPVVMAEQTQTEFKASITGDPDGFYEGGAFKNAGVVQEDGTYLFTKDSTVDGTSYGYAVGPKKDMTIDASGVTLNLKVDSNYGSDVFGITSDSGKPTIKAKTLNVFAKGAGRTEGIHGSADITGDVNLNAYGSGYVLGVYSTGGNHTTIKGNVTMLGKDDQKWGVDNGGNNAWTGPFSISGLYAGATYGQETAPGFIDVDGNVDLAINGTGIFANGGGSIVNVTGGGKVVINEENTETHYSLAGGSGTVYMNVVRDSDGKVTGAGKNAVDLTGNLGVLRVSVHPNEPEKESHIYLGLTTEDSKLHGAAVNTYTAEDKADGWNGYIHLWLQNGAVWTNETFGETAGNFQGSTIDDFYGGADGEHSGYVIQKDEGALTFDNYSGYTTVIYAHEGDGTAAENYAAGDTVIGKAAEGSQITLSTDNAGITTTDKDQVAKVLNALAGKLTYNAWAAGEKNLAGKVQIADGLTASSQSLTVGDITFTDSGKGSYVDSDIPAPGGKTEFTTAITGDAEADAEYREAGITSDGKTYTFQADSTITGPEYSAGIKLKDGITINSPEHTLTVVTDSAGNGMTQFSGSAVVNAGLLSIQASSKDSTLNGLQVSGKTTKLTVNGNVSVNAEGAGGTQGIRVGNGGTFTVNGDVSMKKEDGYAIDGSDGNENLGKNGFWIQGGLGGGANTSHMILNGNVDLKVNGNGIAVNAVGSTFDGNGGTIELKKEDDGVGYAAIRAQNGTINLNVTKDESGAVTGAAGHDVVIKGNVVASTSAVNHVDTLGQHTEINLGLNTAGSSLEGVIYNAYGKDGAIDEEDGGTLVFTGDTNLYLQNGAVWTNQAWGAVGGSGGHGGEEFLGSYVSHFYGGADGDHSGYVIQKDEGALTFDNYSGYTTVIYAHEGDGTAAENYAAGDTVIGKAAEGSGITLSTDNAGITTTDKDQVAKVLNTLAGKLTYNAWAGEKRILPARCRSQTASPRRASP